MEQPKRTNNISRRQLIKWTIPLAGGAIAGLNLSSCKPDAKENKPPTKKQPAKTTARRHDEFTLLHHNKTNVLHYPFLYEKYEVTEEKNMTKVHVNDWQRYLDEKGARFSRKRSGIIFEKLALMNLRQQVDDEQLGRSLQILNRSFTDTYFKYNEHNWRVYDLALQLIALNNSIPEQQRWTNFSSAISKINFNNIKVPKRNTWVMNQQAFEQRAMYVAHHRDEYLKKLDKRRA
jgi:hypothetical protein